MGSENVIRPVEIDRYEAGSHRVPVLFLDGGGQDWKQDATGLYLKNAQNDSVVVIPDSDHESSDVVAWREHQINRAIQIGSVALWFDSDTDDNESFVRDTRRLQAIVSRKRFDNFGLVLGAEEGHPLLDLVETFVESQDGIVIARTVDDLMSQAGEYLVKESEKLYSTSPEHLLLGDEPLSPTEALHKELYVRLSAELREPLRLGFNGNNMVSRGEFTSEGYVGRKIIKTPCTHNYAQGQYVSEAGDSILVRIRKRDTTIIIERAESTTAPSAEIARFVETQRGMALFSDGQLVEGADNQLMMDLISATKIGCSVFFGNSAIKKAAGSLGLKAPQYLALP